MKNFYLNGFQIHSNSQDIGFGVHQNYQGLEAPGIRLTTYDKPGESGSVVSNQLYSGRHIILSGRIFGDTIPNYQIRRRTFQNLLRIVKDANAVSQPTILSFQTMDDLLLQASVYLKDLQMPTASLNHCSYVLTLYAPDPNLYSQSLAEFPISLPTTTGLVYPVIYPVHYPAIVGGQLVVNNNGDANTPLLVTFNGPLTSPFLTNLTTGETFAINLSLGSGDVLIVDMQKKTMLLNGITNALPYFVLTNTWLELIPGDNTLKIGSAVSSDAGDIIVSYRSAYFGI